jgi:hypothetical protein
MRAPEALRKMRKLGRTRPGWIFRIFRCHFLDPQEADPLADLA